ncbi:hypothetical protein V9K67_16535 [Paraflavisolibacter sp. H34]|uniref:MutS-related protein n=1 Tax=Huijunlia imazamoxiresistens TaxID=3127457 RepID=UPI0030161213
MTHAHDLHIAEDILPLFDHTLNDHSKKILATILREPLTAVSEILERQQVLKELIAQHGIFENYSYSRTELGEVHFFLAHGFPLDRLAGKRLKWRLLLSPALRYRQRAQLVQVVLLLHRLYNFYFSRLAADAFPKPFRQQLKEIYAFLSQLHLPHYEGRVREQRFSIKDMVALTGLFHPLLKSPVRNSIHPEANVVLLTGANMSGKSTFLKAVGLCVYLAHAGLGVPAEACVLPFFDHLSVSIDLRDDLQSGYSHFMSELVQVKRVVEAAGAGRCFAIFDELFRGTSLEDALDISAATLRGLTQFQNSVFFVSTHLQPLKELPEVQAGAVACYHFGCELEGKTPVFSYRLLPGWSNMKVGRLLFEREGLDRLLQPGRPV